jgi:hypothetical protein
MKDTADTTAKIAGELTKRIILLMIDATYC